MSKEFSVTRLIKVMSPKNNNIKRKNPKNAPSRDLGRLRTHLSLIGCVMILVSGFFFAGTQHFASMDYGIRNSRLRKQLDDLQAEKRRLLFSREVAISPNEIKKAAKKTGLYDSRQVHSAAVSPQLASLPRTNKGSIKERDERPTLVKTGSTRPANNEGVRAVPALAIIDKRQKPSTLSE